MLPSDVSEPIKIDIWSDVACPWCYIGKRRFESGSALFASAGDDRSVEVEYHSFELSPDTPVDFDGTEVDFLAGHKGIPAEQVHQMLERVTGIAASVGLDYDFDALRHTNTVKAHELLHHAKAEGRQHDMEERLMSAYFTEGRHVGRIEDLADLAAEIGLDVERMKGDMQKPDIQALIDRNAELAQALRITGTPGFVAGDQIFPGATDLATLKKLIEQARAGK